MSESPPPGSTSGITQAAARHHSVVRTASQIVTTEAVLWEWLNALPDASTRTIAAEGYRRVHSDPRIEVVPSQPELNDAAIAYGPPNPRAV